VRRYAARFDKLSVETPLLVSEREMEAAWQQITREQQAALKLAARRIRTYAKRQIPKQWSLRDSTGVQLGQIVRPLEGVACYVPAGRHPLPSTLLMTAIPAQVAVVPRIIVLCPRPTPMVLAAAYLLGTMTVYRIGGAQAIAAAAYGTQSVPRVDKIAGPGSAFVTVAKQLIAADPSNTCSIDMAAGPTETLIASNTGDAEAIAADLFAQAEHDAATLPIFVTTNEDLAKQVREEAKNQSVGNAVARQSLRENGAIFVVASQQEMADVVNRIAPEHLTVDSETDLDWVRNAGSVFVGTQTPQALGDYISGPNHTLPTAGFARQRGGLSVADFVKTISVQSASSTALRKLAPAAIELAQAEGLAAHAASLRLALEKAQQRGRA
jgi:histidinol dehydrogenase